MVIRTFWGCKVDQDPGWFLDNIVIEETGLIDIHSDEGTFLAIANTFQVVFGDDGTDAIKAPVWDENYWLGLHMHAIILDIPVNFDDFGFYVLVSR